MTRSCFQESGYASERYFAKSEHEMLCDPEVAPTYISTTPGSYENILSDSCSHVDHEGAELTVVVWMRLYSAQVVSYGSRLDKCVICELLTYLDSPRGRSYQLADQGLLGECSD